MIPSEEFVKYFSSDFCTGKFSFVVQITQHSAASIAFQMYLILQYYYTWLIGTVINQEPRKTIGYCFENNRLYCFPNPRWPPQISANQELNKEFKMAAPMKVGQVGKQPTSLNGGLESVSQIPMATQITPGSRKNVTQLQNPRD